MIVSNLACGVRFALQYPQLFLMYILPIFSFNNVAFSGKGVYYSQDGGVTWIKSSLNVPTGVNILGIASSSSGQTMAAAVSGK